MEKSSQNEVPAPAPTEPEKKKDSKTCCICAGGIDENKWTGCNCPSGHYMCEGCTSTFVKSIMSSPRDNIPAQCPMRCGAEVVSSTFERNLDREQLGTYIMARSEKELGPGEHLNSCPKCQYFEIAVGELHEVVFLHCRNESCGHVSCIHCHCSLSTSVDGEIDADTMEEVMVHQTHAALAKYKKIWDKAAEDAQARPCPNPACTVRGRKDDGCTHMTCDGCGLLWCYFCGKPISECDQASDAEVAEWAMEGQAASMQPEYRHNLNWFTNGRRCPMYLTEIHEADESWPEDDDQCLDKYHRLLARRLLRDALLRIGEENMREFVESYGEAVVTGTGIETNLLRTDPGSIESWINTPERRRTLPAPPPPPPPMPPPLTPAMAAAQPRQAAANRRELNHPVANIVVQDITVPGQVRCGCIVS